MNSGGFSPGCLRPLAHCAAIVSALACLVVFTHVAARAAEPAATGKPAPTKDASGAEFTVIGFDKLSAFKYEVPDETKPNPDTDKGDSQIPQSVKDFHGKRVALKGFMLPLKVEGGLVTELLIMRDQSMCCFGAVPKINEWVSVKMTGKGVKPVMDQAVTLVGKLKVGGIKENGYLVGIYAMDGERLDAPGT
ncbi:MAG: DUF3299 domain-containing protein [Pedosphaera sp.]|nr:DUF3299 domain-containing protein [Pedosphaera sp.]